MIMRFRFLGIFFTLLLNLNSLKAQESYDSFRSQNGEDLNLTDEERKKSDTYLHKGIEQSIMNEECAGIEKECAGGETPGKFLGMPDQLVQMVGQAYTMINGMTAAPLKLRGGVHTENLKNNPNASSERPDYCGRIPMVGEGMAQFVQQAEQKNMKNIPGEGNTDQKKQLYKAARSHEVRAMTSTLQATVYGSATACYTGMVALGGVQATQVMIKLPACAVLTAFHTKNAIRHSKIAKKIKGIADKLPGPGDCNPITKRRCFCKNYSTLKKMAKQYEEQNIKNQKDIEKDKKAAKEKSGAESTFQALGSAIGFGETRKTFYRKVITLDTMNYDKYCTTKFHTRPLPPTSARTTCVDFKGQMDPYCECTQTDSCMDKQFISKMKGIGKAPYTDEALTDLVALSRGELRNGSVTGQDIGSYAASRLAMKKIALELPPVTLTDNQKVGANAAEKEFGIPREFAAHLARRKFTAADMKLGRQLVSKSRGGGSGNKYRGRKGSGNKNMNAFYKGGAKASSQRVAAARAKNKNIKVKIGASGTILKYAERAANKAQIHKTPERSVFQIISRRYQLVSGRGLIEYGDGL